MGWGSISFSFCGCSGFSSARDKYLQGCGNLEFPQGLNRGAVRVYSPIKALKWKESCRRMGYQKRQPGVDWDDSRQLKVAMVLWRSEMEWKGAQVCGGVLTCAGWRGRVRLAPMVALMEG